MNKTPTNKKQKNNSSDENSKEQKKKGYYYVEIIDNFEDLEELLKSYKSN